MDVDRTFFSKAHPGPALDAYPTGAAYIAFRTALEADCASVTEARFYGDGSPGAKAAESLGTLLSVLERLGACGWECRKEMHPLTYMLTNALNSALAALDLHGVGLYDQSLMQIRSVGEAANLVTLFVADTSELPKWLSGLKQSARHNLQPRDVRSKLKRLGVAMNLDPDRYASHSALVHPASGSPPQIYSSRQPFPGGAFQIRGANIAFAELALAVAFCTAGATAILAPPAALAADIVVAIEQLAANCEAMTADVHASYDWTAATKLLSVP
jgi:hypothetical protein